MGYPDNEFCDFRGEMFRYTKRSAVKCHTWFTPDDVIIHSKRLSRIHRDIDNRAFVFRYGERYYLKAEDMRESVDERIKNMKDKVK